MVVAQDACLRINRGWYSRMGIGSSTSAAPPVAAPVAASVAAPEAAPKPEEKEKKEESANKIAPVNGANGTAGGKRKGGYRPTKKDKATLKKLKQGKSIGFTMRSSLKAKGLLRRANGTMRVSAKYRKN